MKKQRQFSIHLVCSLLLLLFAAPLNADTLKIGTWNIEHLGSPGRGLGGIGAGNLPYRTSAQLRQIASLIKDELKADLLALQEVAVTATIAGVNVSDPLEKITTELGDDWSYTISNSGPGSVEAHRNMRCAYLWNTQKVRLVKAFER